MLKYEEKPQMTDDCLRTARLLGLEIGQTAIAKVCTFNFLVCLTLLSTVQTFLFLQKFDAAYFIKYCPIYAGSFFVATCIICYPIIHKIAKDVTSELGLWKIDSANGEIEQRIKKEALYFDVLMVLLVLCGSVSVVFHIIPAEQDKEIFFVFDIFEKFLPDAWNVGLSWLVRSSYVLLIIIFCQPVYIIMYLFLHFKFQMYMLLHYLESVDHVEQTGPEYQGEIRKRLLFCFQRRTLLFHLARQIVERGYRVYILFPITAVLLGISFLLMFFHYYCQFGSELPFQNAYFKIWPVAICVVGGWSHIIWCGQQFEDTADDELETLKALKWYCWDKENKQIYRIYLICANEGYKARFTETIAVNYELGVQMGKTLYSMLSVLNQLRKVEY